MDDQELRKLHEKLHTEMEQAPSLDDEGKALLRDLDADIRKLLERSGGSQVQAHPSMLRQLEDSIDHLEASHPALTAVLSELLATLSKAGI